MKKMYKRVIAFILAFLMAVSTLTGTTGVSWIDKQMVSDVYAATKRVSLSKVRDELGISEIGRPKSEGLWSMRVGGKKVFCLNSGKALHNSDRAKGKTSDAANYKNQSLAKVLTWYFGVNKQEGGTKRYGLCQAYAWAAGAGKNKKTAMQQAAKYLGASESEASKLYEQINATAPYGKVTYYTIDSCGRGIGGSSHQHLIGWADSKTVTTETPDVPEEENVTYVEYENVNEIYEATGSENIVVNITKTDTRTGSGLAGATFSIFRDDAYVADVTTDANGHASYTYPVTYVGTASPSKEYIYVANWNELSQSEQIAEKAKGYYSSEVYALSAMRSDLKPIAEADLQAQLTATHTWRVVETSAPANHRLNSYDQTQWETGTVSQLNYSFSDSPVSMTLRLKKISTRADYGVQATLANAVYGLYAKEPIYASDNKTVAYAANALVTKLTTDSNGNATASSLYPGLYYLKEITAPVGFEKDTGVQEVELRWNSSNTTVERSVSLADVPILGKIYIKKQFEGEDIPTKFVEKQVLKEDYTPGLCEHHTEHDENCGYVKAVKGHACEHVHTDECYTTTLICGKEESEGHTHTEECYDEEGNLICGQEESEGHTHTDECYEKTLDCKHVHDDTCGYVEAVEGHPCEYFCDICAYTTVIEEQEVTITDEFNVVNSKGKVVDTIKIASEGDGKGTGTSKELPYGNYTIVQTKSSEGYAKVPTQAVNINQTKTYSYTLNDRLDAASFFITKTKSITDEETGTYKKEAEEGAEFELYAPDGTFVKKLTTNVDGIAYSGILYTDKDPMYGLGEYTLKQVKGEHDYIMFTPQKLNITDKKVYYAEYDNTYCGSKIRIQKYKTKAGVKTPESNAEFTIIDADLAGKTEEELKAMTSIDDRLDYIIELEKAHPEAIIDVVNTEDNGYIAKVLDSWKYEDHPNGFIALQTNGEEGYLLADPVYSKDMAMEVINDIHVFSFEATDDWDDWANLTLVKQMKTTEEDVVFEKGAVFRLVDVNGNTVAEKETDENGEIRFDYIDLGKYIVEQVSGDSRHELVPAFTVTLTKEDKHKDVSVTKDPLVNEEKQITFELSKISSETGVLVDGARYQLYRIVKDEAAEGGTCQEFVANLVSGTKKIKDADGNEVKDKGKAVYSLPYGNYLVKEVFPANGYTLDDQEYTFTLDMESVTYDENGDGTYGLTLANDVVTGTIAVNKKGNVITKYNKSSQSFIGAKTNIKGATYALYAREDVTLDNGAVVWAANEKIDEKETDASGNVLFTRTGKDGQETDQFYLGKYYVKETSVPAGFTLDETEHDIVLDWDDKTDQFDDIRGIEDTADVEDPIGNNSPDPNKDKYVLAVGEKVNAIIKNASTVTFTWEKAPNGSSPKSIASDGGNGVVYWNNGSDYYISTQLSGQVIYFNAVSSHMFDTCTKLTKVKFKNVDTSKAVDMSYMFYRCSNMTELDLSSFNTKLTENMEGMFKYCSKLHSVYVNDQKLTVDISFEEDIPSRIIAIPKSEFAVGHRYKVADFLYYMYYENGKSEPIAVSESEAAVNPSVATEAGTKTCQISFASTSKYAEFATIETQVVVKDPTAGLEQTWHNPQITLNLTDEDQKVSIQVVKADAADDSNAMLEGAEFTLYAACDIVNKEGDVILHKDDVIQTQTSGDSSFSYLEFMNLPSAVYKKDASEPYMYYVRETKAPDGYYLDDRTVYCTGKTDDQTKAEFVFGWSGNADMADEGQSYIGSDEYLFKDIKIPYLTLKKEWSGGKANRPDTLSVTVTLPDGTKKNYTLRAEDNWTLVTDIDANLFKNYTSSQIKDRFVEHMTAAVADVFEENGSSWDSASNIYTFRNIYKNNIPSTVEKVWSDGNDIDKIRPKSIQMELYGNDQYIKTVPLPENGKWEHTENNLPATDSDGNEIVYTWKEVATDLINGDARNGYLSTSTETETDDGTKTTITNYHEVQSIDKSIQKVWNDSDDKQDIRTDNVNVQLYGNGELIYVKPADGAYTLAAKGERDAIDTITLNADNKWKTTVTELPAAGTEGDIDYEWKEVLDDETWITGESIIGYKPSYTLNPADLNETILTNTHVYNTGASVKVNKKILKENLSLKIDTPTFTFTLTGKDVYGRDYAATKSVTFTETDLASVDADGYITKEITFDSVPYGTYTVTESGMEGLYKQTTVTPGQNATVNEDGTSFTVKVGPSLEEAKELDK